MTAVYKDDQEDWLTVCLKYLLFVFNFLFWVSECSKCSPLYRIPTLTKTLQEKAFQWYRLFTCVYLQYGAQKKH